MTHRVPRKSVKRCLGEASKTLTRNTCVSASVGSLIAKVAFDLVNENNGGGGGEMSGR